MLVKALSLAAIVASVPALAACGSSSNSSSTSTPSTGTVAVAAATATAPTTGPVSVQLTEWKIAPSATAAKAGKVTFDVKNAGAAPHEMIVLKTDKPAGSLGTGARISEKTSVGEVGELQSGKSGSVTLNLTKGNYVLICNIAGHYMAGMHTAFTVS